MATALGTDGRGDGLGVQWEGMDPTSCPEGSRVPAMQERFTRVGGQRLRYLIGGQDKPLLLCHGFLSSAEEFGGRFGELAAHRTLIVPDLPGNGASAPLPGRHTAAAIAALLDELLDGLGVDRFDVGGLCMGATVACALARRAGSRAGRMVLHTPLLSPTLVRPRYRHQVELFSRPLLWGLVVWLSRRRLVSDLYKRLIVQEGDVDQRSADANYENQRRADPRAAREWLKDSLSADDVDFLASRREPTLIIMAGQDQLVDVHQLRGLVSTLPRVRLFVDAQQGHGWNQTAVHRQLDILRGFFEADPHPTGWHRWSPSPVMSE